MSAQLEHDDWMVGGSADPAAAAAVGVSEAEVASLAVEAYAYAWSKVRDGKPCKGLQSRWCAEVVMELEGLMRDRLQLFEDD